MWPPNAPVTATQRRRIAKRNGEQCSEECLPIPAGEQFPIGGQSVVELGEHGVATPATEDSIHFSVVYLYANRAISFLGQLFSIDSKDKVCEFCK